MRQPGIVVPLDVDGKYSKHTEQYVSYIHFVLSVPISLIQR